MRTLPILVAAALLAGCTSSASGPANSALPSGAPRLHIAVVADGLDHPWDVAQASDGTLLFDQRGGGFTAVLRDGTVQDVQADMGDLFARGETGLMGLVLDPGFNANRRFYSCQGVTDGGTPSIAVIAWTVAADWRSATRDADPLIGDIPANASSGRHGGCRLRFTPDGALLIGTGDNAVGTNPQDRSSRAGKVLLADPATGEVAVWNYGHRNVQGLAVRPGTNQIFAVEQGTFRDDEVNLLRAGGNYGYDPAGSDGGYDESVPMTDTSIPGAIEAVWSSGPQTIATCGGTFLDGARWGAYDGLMLLGVLKGQGVLALRLDRDGALEQQFRLPELEGTHGRIRTVQQGTDGDLYVTTDNGGGDDQLLRVTPR
jgi:glucose/arabinose dehydrogenase